MFRPRAPNRNTYTFPRAFRAQYPENGELLVRRRGGKERAARVFARFCNALCLPHGFFADLEIKIVREKLVKLNTKQTALSQHAAALLDVVAEIRFERRVRDYDRFAEQSTDLRAADVEDIGKRSRDPRASRHFREPSGRSRDVRRQ